VVSVRTQACTLSFEVLAVDASTSVVEIDARVAELDDAAASQH